MSIVDLYTMVLTRYRDSIDVIMELSLRKEKISNEKRKEADEFHALLDCIEKQLPKNPIKYDSMPYYRCPKCHSGIVLFSNDKHYPFCMFCGQAIDWSEEKNE